MLGTVYLLCFAEGGGLRVTDTRHATHYIGWTDGDAEERLAVHLAGRGSPLIRAVVAAGQSVQIARTWPEADRHFERTLKRRREAPRFCPLCTDAGRARAKRAPEPVEVIA